MEDELFIALGAPLTYAVIVLGFAAVYMLIPRKYTILSFVLLVVSLSVYAFYIQPNETDDLSRYYMQLDYLREYGYSYLQRCFDEGINGWDTYRVCGYYFYIFSRFDDNRYMTVATIAIAYGLTFWCLYKAANRFDISKGNLFIGALTILSLYWFYDIWAGIRNGLCFAVIFACAYYHLVEKRNVFLCIIGYVLACFMHSAGFIMVVVVITAYIVYKIPSKFVNIVIVFGISLGGMLINFLADRFNIGLFADLSERAESISSSSNVYTETNYLVNVAVLIVCFIALWYGSLFFKRRLDDDRSIAKFYELFIVVILFCLGSIFNALIFKRMVRWVVPQVLSIFLMLSLEFQQKDYFNNLDSTDRINGYNDIPIRTRTAGLYRIVIVAFLIVHLVYDIIGSSLCWAHF